MKIPRRHQAQPIVLAVIEWTHIYAEQHLSETSAAIPCLARDGAVAVVLSCNASYNWVFNH